MAPVSTPSLNLDDDQRFALMKFRRNVKDCLKPQHNDFYLLRWLRARQWNADAAEKMLRDSLAWREKWEVDTVLPTWDPPEVLKRHIPCGQSGYDKDGAPVIVVPFAGFDIWGLLHSVSRSDVIRVIIKTLERNLAIAAAQGEKHGPIAQQVVAIMDMEGFSLKQYMWKPAGETVIELLQMYEANYPEILKLCYIINVPKVFSLAFSIAKKFMNEYTLSKIKIYKTDHKKWQAAILRTVDPDQIPEHFGGTLNENGDPRCPITVIQGGKVPKHYYTRKTQDNENHYTKVTVKKGDKHSIDFISAQPGCTLRWEVGVENNDIKFSILGRDSDDNETVVHPLRKIHGPGVDSGIIDVDGPATYTVVFDNSYSFLRSKKIYYHINISSDDDLTPLDECEDILNVSNKLSNTSI